MADTFPDPITSNSSTESLHSQAIEAALSCNWNKAEELNKKIIKEDPNNTACLNRLARALFELGKYSQAKKIYQTVLGIDPYNTIAQKNLKRAASFKKNEVKHLDKKSASDTHQTISPTLFLEEAGITKVVNLLKVAEPQKLSRLYPGALVNLVAKNRGISVTDSENNYLGVLADDIAHLLLKLIKGGNKYQALIKSVKTNGLSILIRETYRSRRFKNQPSFLDSSKAITYSSDNITLNYEDAITGVMESESEETTS